MTDNIFEALRESHEIQRSLIRKLMLSRVGEHHVDVFTQLRIELAAHEAAEERDLCAPMLMDDSGLDSSHDALADHHKMEMIVANLQTPNAASRRWIAHVRKLSKKLHGHLRAEEKICFQLTGKILDQSAKSSLAKRYRNDCQHMHEQLTQV